MAMGRLYGTRSDPSTHDGPTHHPASRIFIALAPTAVATTILRANIWVLIVAVPTLAELEDFIAPVTYKKHAVAVGILVCVDLIFLGSDLV